MTTKLVTIKEITFSEGEMYITFTTGEDGHVNKVDTNIPYEKKKKDWEFYQKSIKRLCKYL